MSRHNIVKDLFQILSNGQEGISRETIQDLLDEGMDDIQNESHTKGSQSKASHSTNSMSTSSMAILGSLAKQTVSREVIESVVEQSFNELGIGSKDKISRDKFVEFANGCPLLVRSVSFTKGTLESVIGSRDDQGFKQPSGFMDIIKRIF